MNVGRLEQIAAPSELYAGPATPFVGEFVGISNRVPARVVDGRAQLLDTDVPVLDGSATDSGVALVRPESVTFAADPAGQATVASVAFLGAVSRVSATLDDGTLVTAQLGNTAALSLSVGDRVRVEVAQSPVLVVAH